MIIESLEQRQNNYMHYIAKEHPEIAEEARKTGDYLVLFGEKIIFRAKTEAQCWHFLSTTRLAGIIVTPY